MNRIQLGWEKVKTLFRRPAVRTKGGFRLFCRRQKGFKELPQLDEQIHPAMERLTEQLIEEMVGDNGIITKEFERRIAAYNTEDHPISPKDAEQLMISLLKMAVAGRKLINERLARSIETGALFDSYYDRVHAVSALAVDAHSKMKRMDVAEEDFLYHYDMLLRVRNNTYEEDVRTDYEKLEKVPKRERDILKAIDEAGGC